MTDTPNLPTFSQADMQAFEPAMKIGLLATINPDGLPHLTMISSLKAGSPGTVIWGQFTEGLSKLHVLRNPHTAFLIMTLDKQLWRGKARWTHSQQNGLEFDWYNNIPMFRYNAYFGIHTVHFMDLISHTGQQPLPMNTIIVAAIKTIIARRLSARPGQEPVMNTWTRVMFDKLDNLKFLTFIRNDGFPWIIPIIQAQSIGSDQIMVSTGAFGDEINSILPNSPVALLGLALTMEDVLLRGEYLGIQTYAGMHCARIKVNWVYNPMPPVAGQIYPPTELKTITQF